MGQLENIQLEILSISSGPDSPPAEDEWLQFTGAVDNLLCILGSRLPYHQLITSSITYIKVKTL